MWKFDISTENWTWVSGPIGGNQNAVHGTQGIPSVDNVPVARDTAVSWTDQQGRLWLFGGYGSNPSATGKKKGLLDDLWMFDIPSNTWTWVKGSNTFDILSVHGKFREAASTGTPGGRKSAVTWTDSEGDLWLFGGYSFNSIYHTRSDFNDLWKYNISSGNWAWMKGSDRGNATNEYGTKGIADETNTPGERSDPVAWTDSNGNFWLFGGIERPTSIFSDYRCKNDLWKYEPVNGNWTWVGGSTSSDSNGIYGTPGTPAAANMPGARTKSAVWVDMTGNFWLFGGHGFDDGTASFEYNYLNDMWRLSPPTPTSFVAGWELY